MIKAGQRRFWIGGAGALLPLLVTLLALDLPEIIDNYSELTMGIYVGTFIRYFALFVLGGVVAALNSDENRPIKLVQLGIAAPALISSYFNVESPQAVASIASDQFTKIAIFMHTEDGFSLFSSAHASEAKQFDEQSQDRIILASGFLEDIIKGATKSVGNAVKPDEAQLEEEIDTSPDLLTDNDKAALRVRQIATPTDYNVRDREYVALTYSLDVDEHMADNPKSRIIAHVEKVEYAFDKRWFNPPVRTRTNKLQDFRYIVRVWGSTKVKVAIYLTNPTEILLREGYMDLHATTFLESTTN